MRVDECLDHVGSLLQLDCLQVNEDGGCQIVFEDDLPVDLEFDPDQDRVYVSCLVLPAAQHDPEVHTRALMGNGFGLMTADAAFALDPVTSDLLLTRKLPLAATSVDRFALFLADLVGVAQAWRQDLAAGSPSHEGPDLSASPGPMSGMIQA